MAHGRAEREEATRRSAKTANRGERNAYPRAARTHEDAERRRAVSGVGASSNRRGPPREGTEDAPREPEGTIWATAAANPRTKPRTPDRDRASATDARRAPRGEGRAPSGDTRVSEDGFAPIASVSGYGSCAGSVTNEGDERRRGEDEDDERGGEDEDVARELPAETGHQQTDATKAEEEARRARAAAGKRAEHVTRCSEAAARAATAAAELSTGGAAPATRRTADAAMVAGAANRGAPREGGGTRGGRAGRQRAWGATSGVGVSSRRATPRRSTLPRGTTANAAERRRAIPTPRRCPAAARPPPRARLGRASARGGGSGGGISVASDAGMGRRVGGGGWAAKEEPLGGGVPARGRGCGAGGPPGRRGSGAAGASGPGGPGAPSSRGRAGGRIEREGR